jgi:hypothetical protein
MCPYKLVHGTGSALTCMLGACNYSVVRAELIMTFRNSRELKDPSLRGNNVTMKQPKTVVRNLRPRKKH